MAESRPNVVLISVDSLRADHCGFLGDDRGLTPTLDELAATGVSFERAIAPGPQTFSSMPAIFTGHHRTTDNLEDYPGDSHWQRRIAAIEDHLTRYISLPERFKAMGYATAGFSPNPWASTSAGFDRGFDHFTDMVGKTSDNWIRTFGRRTAGNGSSSKSVQLALDFLTGSSFLARWGEYYEQILATSQQLPEPYFLWVFLLDTHYPFLPTRAYRTEQSTLGMVYSTLRSEKAMRGHADTMPDGVRESMLRSYRDTVRSIDHFLERLRADLAEDDPAIIIHSDHGESFGEHGYYGHHHRNVYEENIHIPYVVHDGSTNRQVADPTSLVSISNVAISIAREGTFEPTAVTEPSVVSTSEAGNNRAVRYRRYKYLEADDQRFLFDLETDPIEQEDVSASYPGLCAKSRARLDRFEGQRRETADLSRAAKAVARETDQ